MRRAFLWLLFSVHAHAEMPAATMEIETAAPWIAGEGLTVRITTTSEQGNASVLLRDVRSDAILAEGRRAALSDRVRLQIPDWIERAHLELQVAGEVVERFESLEFDDPQRGCSTAPKCPAGTRCRPTLPCDLIAPALANAELRGADLRGRDLSRADLRGADLRDAILVDAELSAAALNGANLEGADLSNARLLGADLEGARLVVADLEGADLRDANLRFADLSDANLSNADLLSARLGEARLGGAEFTNARCPDGTLASRRCGQTTHR